MSGSLPGTPSTRPTGATDSPLRAAHPSHAPPERKALSGARRRSYTELADMRRAFTSWLLLAAICLTATGAPRHSWDRVRYAGGTLRVKVDPYDWNTALTVTDDAIVFVFTPSTVFKPGLTLRLKPSQVLALYEGPVAVRRVAEVAGAVVPAKPPRLFGMLSDWAAVGIVYQADDGKRGAILLQTYYSTGILEALKRVTGKTVESGH